MLGIASHSGPACFKAFCFNIYGFSAVHFPRYAILKNNHAVSGFFGEGPLSLEAVVLSTVICLVSILADFFTADLSASTRISKRFFLHFGGGAVLTSSNFSTDLVLGAGDADLSFD